MYFTWRSVRSVSDIVAVLIVHVAADISGSNRNPDSVIDAVLGLCQLRSTLDSILPLDHLVLDSDTESIKEP
jgi:hypothetical protein